MEFCTEENRLKLARLLRDAEQRSTRVQGMAGRGGSYVSRAVQEAVAGGELTDEAALQVQAELDAESERQEPDRLKRMANEAAATLGIPDVQELEHLLVSEAAAAPMDEDELYGLDEDELAMV